MKWWWLLIAILAGVGFAAASQSLMGCAIGPFLAFGWLMAQRRREKLPSIVSHEEEEES